MSEEEAIEYIEQLIGIKKQYNYLIKYKTTYNTKQAIEKILDLYNKEKAKNKRYEKYLKNKDIEHESVLEYLETEKEKDYVSKNKIKEIRDKAEVMDYYTLNNVIDDLSKLIGDYKDE